MRTQRRTMILSALVATLLVFSVSPAMAAEVTGGSPLDALGINVGFLIAQIINFLLILALLRFILWGPMTNMMDARAAKIEKGLEDAAAAASARRNAEAEAEKILAQARTEANQVVAQGSERGDEVAKGIEAEARKEADKTREEARTAATAERDAELAGLRTQVVSIAMAITERMIGESMDSGKQAQLITDFFSKVPEAGKDLSGDVTVVSAMPLEQAEQDKVKAELSNAGSVSFEVDPAILGGLVLRAGDRVVDGSVRSNLSEMQSMLN